MAILVQDSFTRADSATSIGTADTGQTWSTVGSTWGISSNQAYIISGSDGYAYVSLSDTDVKISVKISVLNGDMGIYFRTTDASNWCRAIRSGGNLIVQKMVSGTRTTIGSKAYTFASGNTLSVVSKADGTIDAYVNDVLQISIPDTAHAAVTRHGIGVAVANTSGRYDDFTIETLATGGTTLTGSATLQGVGTLSSSGIASVEGSATLQGVATLTASGSGSTPTPSATFTGVGTLSASGIMTIRASATLQGVGTLTAIAGVSATGSATFQGVATLTAYGADGTPITSVVRLLGEIAIISLAGEVDSVSVEGSVNPSSVALEGEL